MADGKAFHIRAPAATWFLRRMQPGTVAERRIYAAVNSHNLTSCRINPAFLPKRCDWIFCSIKVRLFYEVARHFGVTFNADRRSLVRVQASACPRTN
jgi:predicted Abi (CAAX) family protease